MRIYVRKLDFTTWIDFAIFSHPLENIETKQILCWNPLIKLQNVKYAYRYCRDSLALRRCSLLPHAALYRPKDIITWFWQVVTMQDFTYPSYKQNLHLYKSWSCFPSKCWYKDIRRFTHLSVVDYNQSKYIYV